VAQISTYDKPIQARAPQPGTGKSLVEYNIINHCLGNDIKCKTLSFSPPLKAAFRTRSGWIDLFPDSGIVAHVQLKGGIARTFKTPNPYPQLTSTFYGRRKPRTMSDLQRAGPGVLEHFAKIEAVGRAYLPDMRLPKMRMRLIGRPCRASMPDLH
jgi:hypothetical protein